MPTLECDRCQKTFDAEPDATGKATCPHCGDVHRVGRVAKAVAQERELLVVRPALFRGHPVAYGGLVLLGLAGLVGAIVPLFGVVTAWLSLVGVAILLVAAIGFLKLFVFSHRWHRLRVTDMRTIDERGIVTRTHSEVLHEHAINIRIRQSVWQRIVGLGDFEIDSAAGGAVQPTTGGRSTPEIAIRNIPRPYEVKALIDRHRRA
jgi:membrane protein implicated in regulation of membrane protease activity